MGTTSNQDKETIPGKQHIQKTYFPESIKVFCSVLPFRAKKTNKKEKKMEGRRKEGKRKKRREIPPDKPRNFVTRRA